jgi:hypothetical protein
MTSPATQKLLSELSRLYLLPDQRYLIQAPGGDVGGQPAGPLSAEILAQHLLGQQTIAIELATVPGMSRTLVIDFFQGGGARHWDALCLAANAMQEQLGLPAPAVAISGGAGYALWLSLEAPVPVGEARQFLQLLRAAYWPDLPQEASGLRPLAFDASAELPPCLHQASGKWAAFINASMGAAFAEDAGLEMAPPAAAQAAFLEGLQSISAAQFQHALAVLRNRTSPAPATVATGAAANVLTAGAPPQAHSAAAVPAGLLLKDASLEDIVNFLHGKNIEPTFRHLIPK